jgi:di/tricarboxylate transporter
MTLQMVLALAVMVFMIVMMMTDALPFGAPPVFACVLLVVLGVSDIKDAFSGFSNGTVWMIAFFMVLLAAAQKTTFMSKIKDMMLELVEKGGYKSYAAMIVVVMLGASLVGMGATGYYMLILGLVASIPYNDKMPASKLIMPLGFATNHPLVPVNVALQYGIVISVLQTGGYTASISMFTFALVNFFLSLAFLLWALIAYKSLPSHAIAKMNADQKSASSADKFKSTLPAWEDKLTIFMFLVSIISMMMMNILGDAAYIIPGLCSFVLLFAKVLDFQEFRDNLFSPIILLTAGVIGVANALTATGLSALVGDAVAGVLGQGISPFLLVLIFALLTSTTACFTGSNVGSVYVFAPIAIATCVSLGYSPVAPAVAICVSGWCGHYMPIDGLPAMIYGIGNYTMKEFWKFTIPMYFVRILALSAAACLLFPMV